MNTRKTVQLPRFIQPTPRTTLVSTTSLRHLYNLVTLNILISLVTIFISWRLSQ